MIPWAVADFAVFTFGCQVLFGPGEENPTRQRAYSRNMDSVTSANSLLVRDRPLRLAAAGALIAVGLPLFLVIANGHMAAQDAESAMALSSNPWWTARGWITLVYFPASLVAVLGAGLVSARQRPLAAVLAAAAFVMASTLDLAFRSQQLLVVYGTWADIFTATADASVREAILRHVDLFEAAGRGWRAAFLTGFATSRLALATAIWNEDVLTRATAVAWAVTGLMNLQTVLALLGISLGPQAGAWYLLPWGLSFFLLAIWLAGHENQVRRLRRANGERACGTHPPLPSSEPAP